MTDEIDIENVTLEEAQDIVGEWVSERGGTIVDNYQRLDRNWVRPNPWNPNEQSDFMYSHQLEVMRGTGQIAPILVREVGPDKPEGAGNHLEEHYQILDGEHRWKATGDLGWQEISANNLGDVPDDVASMITVIMNHISGESDPIALGKLFKTLRESASGNKDRLDRISKWAPFQDREIDVLVDAVRTEKRSATLPSRLRNQSTDVKFTFKIPTDAASVCNKALETIIKTRNCSPDNAFELMCSDYLAGAEPDSEKEAPSTESEFKEVEDEQDNRAES